MARTSYCSMACREYVKTEKHLLDTYASVSDVFQLQGSSHDVRHIGNRNENANLEPINMMHACECVVCRYYRYYNQRL